MSQIETQELALFRSVHDALKFACNFKHGQIKATGLAVLMGGAKPVGRGLSGLDGAAQAGMVLAEVAALEPKVRGQIIIARYTVREIQCPCQRLCCRGFRESIDWLAAISLIAESARTDVLQGTIVDFFSRHAIVRRHFGDKRSFKEISDISGIPKDTVSQHSAKVVPWLKSEEKRALYAIEGRLKTSQIIE